MGLFPKQERHRIVLHQPQNGGLKCPHLLQSKQCRGVACYEDETDAAVDDQDIATTQRAKTAADIKEDETKSKAEIGKFSQQHTLF